MKRFLSAELSAWKERPNRKPLILKGARQVGKTWLLREFGAANYERVAYFDLLANSAARAAFEADLDANRIVRELSLEAGFRIDEEGVLVVLDEIQESSRAVTALKYFSQELKRIHVAAAGSYLGIASHEGASYPVGHVDVLELGPLCFGEYLQAAGEGMLAETLAEEGPQALSEAMGRRLQSSLRQYMFAGGMPAVVEADLSQGDPEETRRVQRQILENYDADFSKHAPVRILERMRLVWASLGPQLAKENAKFVYGAVRPGARARDFEEAIQWLVDYGAVSKVPAVSAPRIPLAAYASLSRFKLFALDVGLLGALVGLSHRAIVEGDALFTEFKGALTEQYVHQQLKARGLAPYYWTSGATAEVDFVVEYHGRVLPIEVKAAENTKAKSLKQMVAKYGLDYGLRMSLSSWRQETALTNLPLWAAPAFASGQGIDR